jgi:ubiquitin-like modifier-activating enzyme ATG7
MQPTKIQVDLSFWLAFTKLKLDEWKLTTPSVEITASISLPNNDNMPSDLVVNDQSLPGKQTSVIGGLIQSHVGGILIHTNTIEEFEAFDVNGLLQEQWQELVKRGGHDQSAVHTNRFVMLVFGDLKNYKFMFKSFVLEADSSFIQQQKANRLTSFITDEQRVQMAKVIQERLLRESVQVEPQAFVIKPGAQGYELVDNPQEFLVVPAGGYLCFLDPSPKLPSNLLANHVSGRVKQLKNGETLNVLLIREKVSKLSKEVNLKTSLQLILGNGEPANDQVTMMAIDIAKTKPKVTELRRFMDPGNLAEQAVGLNLKLMKWRQMPELDLEVLKETKCLLLGSGSLGC